MITRRKYYEKLQPTKDAHKVYIVCEGKGTEPDYFAFFEGLSSNLEVVVIPPEDGSDPMKLKALAESKFFGDDSKFRIDYQAHDTLWFVIDTDTWEREGKISPLRRFCSSINSEGAEAWKKFAEDVESHPSFKEYVNSVISGGFDFQRDPARLEAAIANSKANFIVDEASSPNLYSTEVYRLGEEILGFVKKNLERLRNKMSGRSLCFVNNTEVCVNMIPLRGQCPEFLDKLVNLIN